MKQYKLEMTFELEEPLPPIGTADLLQSIAAALLKHAPPGTSLSVVTPPEIIELNGSQRTDQ